MEFQESTELQSLKEIVRFAPSVYEDRQTRNYEDFIRIVCNALKNAVNKICEDISSAPKKRHQDHRETGRRFVHYTSSIHVGPSMLKKSCGISGSNDYLRMYDSAHFNDPDEGHNTSCGSQKANSSASGQTQTLTSMLTSHPLSQYEEVYLKAYSGGREAKAGLDAYFSFYNNQRPHQALG